MPDRYCSNCSHCKRVPDTSRVKCSKGFWSMPSIDAEWLQRFKYLPVCPEDGSPLATKCPMFEADE